ncbi:hypothetical protein PEBR_31789 [Penicillium brasilianum]|uniref:Uncharacterized protein n=1 Tax=Penicillium brasilianum TaxID=104259 RepID=A0A1S9RFF2_PENBI|nr:hypothetical protein PEBR_31789 [Penicillium brasilianum]
MGTSQLTLPTSPEFSSRERIANHIELMRRFKCILEDAEQPSKPTQAFPPPPPRILGQKDEAKWNLQCLLMSAEVRYSMYLRILARWITSRDFQSSRDEWPLPPWDVAIVFYAHLLSPFNFQRDIESHFPSLWRAEIEFPLAGILSTNTDEASKRLWQKGYPDTPYQIVDFTPAGELIYVTENGMDIHGYKCRSTDCAGKGAYVIPMTEWPQFRVGHAEFVCPGCKTRTRATKATSVLELCRRAFGFPIFDLWDSPQRQFGKQGFVDRILALTQTQGQLPDHVFRYLKFLQLMKENKSTTLVPTLDIDLLWHTHQLSPVAYEKYCNTHVGRRINHVDTIHATRRSPREDDTASLWAMRYGESYFDPQNTVKTAEIEKRKAAYQKDLEGIGTKLAAYDGDRKHLKTALDEVNDRLETKLTAYREAQDAATALSTKLAGIQTSIESIKPTLRLLTLRYYRQPRRQHLKELQKEITLLTEQRLYMAREVDSRYQEYSFVYRKQGQKLRLWEEAQRDRRRLEQQLTLEVAKSKAEIWHFNRHNSMCIPSWVTRKTAISTPTRTDTWGILGAADVVKEMVLLEGALEGVLEAVEEDLELLEDVEEDAEEDAEEDVEGDAEGDVVVVKDCARILFN